MDGLFRMVEKAFWRADLKAQAEQVRMNCEFLIDLSKARVEARAKNPVKVTERVTAINTNPNFHTKRRM